MNEVNTLLQQLLNFLKENPHILTAVVVLCVISLAISVIKQVARWVIILLLASVVASVFFGYNVWEQNKTLNTLKQNFHSNNIKIESINGDTVKAVVNGATQVVKLTDGKITDVLNSKSK